MPHDQIPPPPPSPPQPRQQRPTVVHHHQPNHGAARHPEPQLTAEQQARMFAEQQHHAAQQAQAQAQRQAHLDANLLRNPDGSLATWYVRLRFILIDPQPGQRRTWARAHRQPMEGDSQQSLQRMVTDHEKQTRLKGRQILQHKNMTPEKRRQIETVLLGQNQREPDQRFEWLPAMVKATIEEDRQTKEKFTRSMDVILKRVPKRIPKSILHQASLPQAHPQAFAPHQQGAQYPHSAGPQHHAGAQYPPHGGGGHANQFEAAREAVRQAAAQAAAQRGVEVLDEEEEDEDEDECVPLHSGGGGDGEHRGHKKDKKDKKRAPEVHQNRTPVYPPSNSPSESEDDSLWGSDRDTSTPRSSVSGMEHYFSKKDRRPSDHKGHYRRGSNASGGQREHKHRSPPRVTQYPSRTRGGAERRYSNSVYSAGQAQRAQAERAQADAARREEDERRMRDTEIRLARTEGMLAGMSLGAGGPQPQQQPRLQINDRDRDRRRPPTEYRGEYSDYGGWGSRRPRRFSRGYN